MKEDAFIRTCSELYTSVSELLKSNDALNDRTNKNNIAVRGIASLLVDESGGYIQTNNQDLVESFNEVLELSRDIVRLSYDVSHYASEIERETKKIPVNAEQIANTSKMFAIKKNSLINCYKKIAEITEKVNAKGKAK